MLQIGPFHFPNPWILAPMAGVSEMPFRVIARAFGAGAAPTELVSAKGLLYGQSRSERYLAHDSSEQPFWVQIFGGDPESMAAGAERAVSLGAQIIDINMGCPVRKVTRNGAGSALMCDPERAAAIVTEIRKRTNAVVTAKLRAGWDENSLNAPEVAKRLEDAGCAAVALHARTRAQGYSGRADWSLIADLVAAVSIPVIGNGDVRTPVDAQKMIRDTGCAGVMIGRGALGNPWIFSQLATDAPLPTPSQRCELVIRHLLAHVAHVGDEGRAVKSFRPHLMWYAHGFSGAAAFRRRATTITDLSEVMDICRDFFGSAIVTDSPAEGGLENELIDLGSALG